MNRAWPRRRLAGGRARARRRGLAGAFVAAVVAVTRAGCGAPSTVTPTDVTPTVATPPAGDVSYADEVVFAGFTTRHREPVQPGTPPTSFDGIGTSAWSSSTASGIWAGASPSR
jgi:hypothetical protein